MLDGLKFIEIQGGLFGGGVLIENYPVVAGLNLSSCLVKLMVILRDNYVCHCANCIGSLYVFMCTVE